jgi:hypothetical protein
MTVSDSLHDRLGEAEYKVQLQNSVTISVEIDKSMALINCVF